MTAAALFELHRADIGYNGRSVLRDLNLTVLGPEDVEQLEKDFYL